VAADLGRAAALARRRADEAGWVREQGPDGRWRDVCPWCNAVLLAGADPWAYATAGRRPPVAPGPVPRTIGEAAALARRRGDALRAAVEAVGEAMIPALLPVRSRNASEHGYGASGICSCAVRPA
jgi:hypothetical protein